VSGAVSLVQSSCVYLSFLSPFPFSFFFFVEFVLSCIFQLLEDLNLLSLFDFELYFLPDFTSFFHAIMLSAYPTLSYPACLSLRYRHQEWRRDSSVRLDWLIVRRPTDRSCGRHPKSKTRQSAIPKNAVPSRNGLCPFLLLSTLAQRILWTETVPLLVCHH